DIVCHAWKSDGIEKSTRGSHLIELVAVVARVIGAHHEKMTGLSADRPQSQPFKRDLICSWIVNACHSSSGGDFHYLPVELAAIGHIDCCVEEPIGWIENHVVDKGRRAEKPRHRGEAPIDYRTVRPIELGDAAASGHVQIIVRSVGQTQR